MQSVQGQTQFEFNTFTQFHKEKSKQILINKTINVTELKYDMFLKSFSFGRFDSFEVFRINRILQENIFPQHRHTRVPLFNMQERGLGNTL